MDEHDKRLVGEQIEPGGRPKAPGRLELLQRFINTYNHDFPSEWDRLGTREKAHAWLQHKRLVGPDVRISAADAARLRELREAIRALTIANQAGQPDPASTGHRPEGVAHGSAQGRRRRCGTDRPGTRSAKRRRCGRGAAGHPARGAAHRSVAAVEGVSAVRPCVL